MEKGCKLESEGNINHDGVRPLFRETLYFCPLFVKPAPGGMKYVSWICGHCCLKINQVCARLVELVMKKTVIYEDLEENPRLFFQYLPEELKKYAETVAEMTGKDWEEIRGVCNSCKPMPVEPPEIPKPVPKKMSNVARRDARGVK